MNLLHTLLTFTLAMAAGSCTAQDAEDRQASGGVMSLDAVSEQDSRPVIQDPWEGMNRKVHNFNNAADRYVLRPLAVGYDKVTPVPLQAGISRFFANLAVPLTAVNQVLQGRPGEAIRSTGRFATNTTLGIAGIFDPASRLGMPASGAEDFGQTLAVWGWRDSRYVVLPLLGPRTLRDTVGIVGDQPLSPVSAIQDSGAAAAFQTLEVVDMRAGLLPLDEMRRSALDDYALVRDVWSQRRNGQIRTETSSNQAH